MLTIERRAQLKRIIFDRKTVSVSEMADYFSVSLETIRRDLAVLEAEGLITKSYGEATLRRNESSLTTYEERLTYNLEAKRSIAREAVRLIQPHDCIFVDHSTTALRLSEFLPDISLTIVTNSQAVISAFSSHKNAVLICTGGVYDNSDQGFFGVDTVNYLQNHFFDKAFLSCRSIDIGRGVCASKESVSEMWRQAINSSKQVFLLLDHTKIGRPAFILVSTFSKISRIITDQPLSDEWSQYLDEIRLPVTISG